MVRPQYANALAVTHNPQLKEVVINFAHEYPVFAPSTQENKDAPVELQTLGAQEDVCGIVLPEDIAYMLRDILEKILPAK